VLKNAIAEDGGVRKIIVNAFTTLDGIMQAPGGPEEDPTGGFKHGGWSVNYWDEMMAKAIMDDLLAKPFDLLAARPTTYSRPTGRMSKTTRTS
jgi:hypothetical protein